MKKLISIVIFGIISLHAQSFSGVFTIQTQNFELKETSNITCYLSYPQCKMEINSVAEESSGNYTMFFNDTQSDVVMISGGTKTTIPVSSIPPNKYLENVLIAVESKTTKQIAGYECVEVTMKSINATIKCYVAKALEVKFPSILNYRGVMKALNENSIGGTPLEIHVYDFSDNELFSQQITSVKSQPLDESIFKIE